MADQTEKNVALAQQWAEAFNNDVEQLGEDYLRLAALGAYGSFFNIYFCSVTIKINGPAGGDILLPLGGQVDPSQGRCAFVK